MSISHRAVLAVLAAIACVLGLSCRRQSKTPLAAPTPSTPPGIEVPLVTTPPAVLLKEPIPLDPILDRIHHGGIHQSIIITYEIEGDGSVENCLVESPELDPRQVAEICGAVSARVYAAGRPMRVSKVSSVHLR